MKRIGEMTISEATPHLQEIVNKKNLVRNGDWVSPKPGCERYLTAGKRYQVYTGPNGGNIFNIIDDVGDEIRCSLICCDHSRYGWYIHSASEDEVEDNAEGLIEIL